MFKPLVWVSIASLFLGIGLALVTELRPGSVSFHGDGAFAWRILGLDITVGVAVHPQGESVVASPVCAAEHVIYLVGPVSTGEATIPPVRD